MSSYISSFKALFAAALMIVAAEIGYSAVDDPSAVERSSYLNWNFNERELFHKILIYEKLRNAIAAKPDVIQVGDSSGLHAIVPSIVEQYVPDLRYANLSCCANTGYDGYYTIAEFMLRHVPSIKAVVLYVAWSNTFQHPDTLKADVVGSRDRLRSAFGPMAAAPPSLAAREDTLRPVYSLSGALSPTGSLPFDRQWPAMLSSLRAQQGWMVEQDKHRIPTGQDKLLKSVCSPSGDFYWDDPAGPLVPDILGRPQSYFKLELMRLASLTARHHAKLIVMFQPHPCPMRPQDSFIASRQADVAAVMAAYSNVVVPAAPDLFEHWSGRRFTSADHLRTGNEDAASRRLGRALAKAFGLPLVEPPAPPSPAALMPAWSTTDFAAPPWRYDDVHLHPTGDGGAVVTETATMGWHRLERVLPDLPAKTYEFSVTFGTTGTRQIDIYMRDLKPPADQAVVHCDAKDGAASANGKALDWAIERLADQRFRCWGKLKLDNTGAVIGIIMSPAGGQGGPYQGDGAGSVVLHDVNLSSVEEAKW
jgi:hypothetical protein